MRILQTDRGPVQIACEREKEESGFDSPAGWRLLRRMEMDCKMPNGKGLTLFYERWHHHESQSGIVTYSTFEVKKVVCPYGYRHEAASVYYVVEGYGIGTLDSDFREIGDIAPIQRTEHGTLEEARQALRVLMEDNIALSRGGRFGDRQAATRQLPKREHEP